MAAAGGINAQSRTTPRHPELLGEGVGDSDSFLQTNAWPYIGSRAFFGYFIDSGPCSSQPISRRSLTLRTKASLLGASSMVYLRTEGRVGVMLNLRQCHGPLRGLVRTLAIPRLLGIQYLSLPAGSSPPLSGY